MREAWEPWAARCWDCLLYTSELSDGHNPIMKQNFGLMLEALDDLKEDEVYICTGSSPSYALVGELMCTRMQILKAAGAVVNGYHRDTKGIVDLDFPCFSYGRYAQDQGPRGKVIDFRVPIEIEGVRVNPGAVSYTHLDVYKRQVVAQRVCQLGIAGPGAYLLLQRGGLGEVKGRVRTGEHGDGEVAAVVCGVPVRENLQRLQQAGPVKIAGQIEIAVA